ncbi:Orn/Lys/Arg family decarboxylase [Staphylococcus nepalensis]|uniref:Orn/Lys/Arg family decarboxylase n=1 Tax=Staphylococcus nepalensis TaxID=214473 RepID=UPI001A9A00DB|nr:lysine decarboxylase [Staphylococcus nepalensis]MBO1222687.1 lysine decarboxylase [Staphylococcus nepalensis]
MNGPLMRKFNELLNAYPISLHVPGHKNMTIGYLEQLNFKMDMTEITGLDDLHHPESVIAESMEGISKHPDYDAYYLVNGTTSGILSVIQAFSKEIGKYAIARNAHKSVFHGLDLVQAQAKLLEMDISDATNQYLGPKKSFLYNQIKDSKLAIFTYPNYYGECFDIHYIMDCLKALNVPSLIDEAHGAHFGLEHFPVSSLTLGADYVVQSYHKTLPALTMSSVIFIHKNAPYRNEVIKYLTYFQSSSPSYLLMNSLELAQTFYDDYDSKLFFKKRKQLIQLLKRKGLEIVEVEDPLKLSIRYKGYKGYALQSYFEEQNIYVELSDDFQVLIVLPLWHEDDRYPFAALLSRLDNMYIAKRLNETNHSVPFRTESGLYHGGDIAHVREIDFRNAENKILANHIIPYPPGIPLMFKGEKITENMVKLMDYWCSHQLRVEGIKNYKIEIKDE